MSARLAACALVLALALAACKSEPEPRFTASCAPHDSMEKVTCTIKNHGDKGSRACLRARIVPPPDVGPEIVTRRVCTAVLEPGQSAQVIPQLEQLGRIQPAQLLSSQCLGTGEWRCKVEVVETSREMFENLPKER